MSGTFFPGMDGNLPPEESAPQAAPPGADEPGASIRMDMLAGGSSDPFMVEAPRRRRISSQSILMILALLGSGAGILAMRHIGMGPRSGFADTVKMPDYDPAKAPSQAAAERALAELSADRAANQVPPDKVQKNPFRMAGAVLGAVPLSTDGPADVSAEDPAERQRQLELQQRAQDIENAAANLVVNSVMDGSTPLARVVDMSAGADKVVRIGDTIAEYFTVVAIHNREVILEADGKQYRISIPEGGSGGGGAPPRRSGRR